MPTKATEEVKSIPAPTPEEVIFATGLRGNFGVHGTLDTRFTLNLKSTGEISLTIRVDEENELETLLAKWEPLVIVYPDPADKNGNGKPRYFPGDQCPSCNNKLVRRQGRNGKFLACLGYPDCTFSQSL